MYEYHDGWVRRASGEVVVALMKPEIVFALMFESKVGAYFEFISYSHSQPGIMFPRPGF